MCRTYDCLQHNELSELVRWPCFVCVFTCLSRATRKRNTMRFNWSFMYHRWTMVTDFVVFKPLHTRMAHLFLHRIPLLLLHWKLAFLIFRWGHAPELLSVRLISISLSSWIEGASGQLPAVDGIFKCPMSMCAWIRMYSICAYSFASFTCIRQQSFGQHQPTLYQYTCSIKLKVYGRRSTRPE